MGRCTTLLGAVCGLLLAHCATGSSSFEGDDDGAGASITTGTSASGGTGTTSLTGGGGSVTTTSSSTGGTTTSTETTSTTSSTSTTTTTTTSTTTTTTATPTCTNPLQDGGLELGTPNARWTESSTNFGTPLCTEADCGLGGGTGPYQGVWWAWFGGIDSEVSSLSQSVVIPVGANTLRFQMELPVCDIAAYDWFEIRIDGVEVYYTDGDDSRCNMIGYQQRSVNIAAYANGASHTIMFRGTNDSLDISNFFVDDVALVCN